MKAGMTDRGRCRYRETGFELQDTTQAGYGQPAPLETVLEPDAMLWAKAETLVAQQMAELVAAGKELPKQLETGEDP